MNESIERAWAALEEGRAKEALATLRDAPADASAGWCVAALALRDLGEMAAAEDALSRAAGLAEEGDPDLLFATGELALCRWDLEAARAAFERVEGGSDDPAIMERLGLLADLEGDLDSGSRHVARARALVGSPPPPRLDEEAFEDVVGKAIESLPQEFRRALEDVAVIVDPVPARALARADPASTPPDLLGLFVGRSLLERDQEAGPEAPPAVYLFQRNLERSCADLEELVEEIRVTLFHELGHALGFEEDEVHDMGLG